MNSSGKNPIRAEKQNKLQNLRGKGIDPFPHNYRRTARIEKIIGDFKGIEAGEVLEDKNFKIAGRLMTKRPMGKAAFFNIQDQSGNLQCYLKKSELDEKSLVSYENTDIGDIIGVGGFVFKSRKGELSLHVRELRVLCKSLEPLPEKYHGLKAQELKYRHRHLDLIMNPETRRVFETRSKILSEIRKFLDSRGFLEVETPVLQPLYGGAAAQPFVTHHRSLDMKLYLKISPELYLKRLIVGGFEKVYELGKNFRNEGMDRSHNPEFTMLEWYEAYTDYQDQMKQFEELVSHLALKITGSMKVNYQDQGIDFTPPWDRLTVYEGIGKYAGLDPEKASEGEIFEKLKNLGSDRKKPGLKAEMLMELFDFSVEDKLIQPTFVMDFPVEVSPLTKKHRENPGLVERFEPFCAGMEIGNSYTELNDPEDQLERFREQEKKRVIDKQAQPMDSDFIHAIDVGMPPTGGVGLGVERIVMLLTNCSSIRDVLLFPTMKHKNQ